jgi:glucose/arabinose dehydrogenase
MGLRNPWRFSFDRISGDLYAGDVGWGEWEEVNIIESGKDYGWPTMEGPECTYPPCDQTGLEKPYHAYSHDVGIAVIGGNVYRGGAIPELYGIYLFADHRTFTLWALESHPSGIPARSDLPTTPLAYSSWFQIPAPHHQVSFR